MDSYSKLIQYIKQCDTISSNIENNNNTKPHLYINTGIYNQAEASSIIQINNTIVTCGLKVKVHVNQKVNQHIPLNKGIIVSNVELTPLCSRNIQQGLPGEESQFLTDQIQFILSNNGPDLDKLVIKENKAVYVLYFDFIVLNHSGNLLDACVLAANAVLYSAKIPNIIWNNEKDNFEALNQDLISLHLKPLTYCITYSICDGQILLNTNEEVEKYVKNEYVSISFLVNISGECAFPMITGILNENNQKMLASIFPLAIDRMKILNEAVLNACK